MAGFEEVLLKSGRIIVTNVWLDQAIKAGGPVDPVGSCFLFVIFLFFIYLFSILFQKCHPSMSWNLKSEKT